MKVMSFVSVVGAALIVGLSGCGKPVDQPAPTDAEVVRPRLDSAEVAVRSDVPSSYFPASRDLTSNSLTGFRSRSSGSFDSWNA